VTHEVQVRQLRTFGLMVGGIFALIALWPLFFRSEEPRLWAIILAGLLMVPALAWPKSLRPIYQVWMVIGEILGRINTRIILGLILYGLFTPIGFVRQFLLGKDSMRRRFEPDASTYGVMKQSRPGSHMTRQF